MALQRENQAPQQYLAQRLSCHLKTLDDVGESFSADMKQRMQAKLFMKNGRYDFGQLSDSSGPTRTEKEGIVLIATGFENCEHRFNSQLPRNMRGAFDTALNEQLSVMAKLAKSQISYGEYAEQINEILDKRRKVLTAQMQYEEQKSFRALQSAGVINEIMRPR